MRIQHCKLTHAPDGILPNAQIKYNIKIKQKVIKHITPQFNLFKESLSIALSTVSSDLIL